MKLSFEQVCAGYRKKKVLDGVSFAAEPGSITALIGRNGAGKSTLVSCLLGEKQDYSGTILLDGQNVRQLQTRELACRIACLPQMLPRPHVTVEELVSFGRTPYTSLMGRQTPQDAEIIQWAISAVGLEERQDAFVDTLSGGERKKAFFAMTLAQDTPVIVLDEPTAHLDTVSRFAFMDLIDVMRRKTGKTFLVVMHDLPEVLRYADQMVALQDGKVAFCGTADQCLAAGIPERCFQIHITGNREQGYAVMPL